MLSRNSSCFCELGQRLSTFGAGFFLAATAASFMACTYAEQVLYLCGFSRFRAKHLRQMFYFVHPGCWFRRSTLRVYSGCSRLWCDSCRQCSVFPVEDVVSTAAPENIVQKTCFALSKQLVCFRIKEGMLRTGNVFSFQHLNFSGASKSSQNYVKVMFITFFNNSYLFFTPRSYNFSRR